MNGVGTDNELPRHKSHDARRTFHQVRDACACIFVRCSQLFFRIIPCNIFQTKKPDREILPTDFPPICYLFIENILYLYRSKFTYLISLFNAKTYPSSITRLWNSPTASEKRNKTISTIVRLVTKPLQANMPSIIFSKTFFILPTFFCAQRKGVDIKAV